MKKWYRSFLLKGLSIILLNRFLGASALSCSEDRKSFAFKSLPEINSVRCRRNVMSGMLLVGSSLTRGGYVEASEKGILERRLDAEILTMPPPSSSSSEFNGIDNLYYPPWMQGTWDVTQTLVHISTPLGIKFVGGPAGSEAIAAESLKEQRAQLNLPVHLKLRFVQTKFGVAEDRLYNTRQRLDSFAGRSVVSSVEYANVGGSNRASVLAMGGSENDPLQTSVVRFKGPAAQKTFLLSHGGESLESDPDTFIAFETLRSIFALTNQNTAPPVTTDTECIWKFQRDGDDSNIINARLRLASYLNSQTDKLYFDAKNRAVSFADYDLKMMRKE